MLKIGGSVGAENDAALDAVVALNDAGHPLVVVHGGGPLVGEWAERMGMETRFVRGLRVSDAETRDLALAVLGGLANGRVVATLIARGVPAVGLTGIDGGILRAEREDAELGFVGRVTLVDSALIEELIDAGRVPIVAPAALDRTSGQTMRQVYVEGLVNVLVHLPKPTRFLYVSSSSVYGQVNGEEVDEDRAAILASLDLSKDGRETGQADPGRQRGRHRRSGESVGGARLL